MQTSERANQIRTRLNEVFCSVFNDDSIVITEKTSAADIDEWDSLMHITLIVNVEKEFGIRLNSNEVSKLKNVGELLKIITDKSTN